MNTFIKTIFVASTTASVLAFGIQSVKAASITTGGCASSTSCTLQELGSGGKIYVDPGNGKLISVGNFTVDVFPGGPTVPSLSSIIVTPTEIVSNFSFGLTFEPLGLVSNLANSDFGINYTVSSINMPGITGASLGDLTYGGVIGQAPNFASVTKTVNHGSGSSVANVTSGINSNDSVSFAATPSISVTDILRLNAQVPSSTVSIDRFTQIYTYQTTTPEPGTILGLLAFGSLGALSRKRKG